MASDASNPALFLPPIPGFDFLQSLVRKNTGVGLPGFGQWVAPTLNPEELEKRIEELKAVQYWLEQNARMLAATIQALEVQRMTLSTLKTMNVQMTDLRDALMVRPADAAGAAAPVPPATASRSAPPAAALAQSKSRAKPSFPLPPMFAVAAPPSRAAAGAPKQSAAAAPTPKPPASQAPAGAAGTTTSTGPAGAAGAAPPNPVDAMQWWAALTQQFADLASSALRDTALSAQKLAAGRPPGEAAQPAGDAGAPADGNPADADPAAAPPARPNRAGERAK